MRPLPGLLLALVLVAAATPAALAGGDVILRYRDGRLVAGRVVEVREDGVLFASGAATMVHRWQDLTPLSAYEARASVLTEDDAAGRLELGRWCLSHDLPGEARKEVLRARGLGAGKGSEGILDTLLAECDRAEAEAALVEAERREAAGDFDGAIEALRTYLMRAPASEWTDRARERAADVVRRREDDRARKRLRAEEDRRKQDADRRAGRLRKALEDADGAREEGARLALVGIREEGGGAFSRFRDSLLAAETRFLEARVAYEQSRRLAGDGDPEGARTALSGRRAVEARLLDVYLRLARAHVAHRNWEEAQKALDKALRIDPVNQEALDLQEKVKANWIRRKASDLTNARGTTSDGSGSGGK